MDCNRCRHQEMVQEMEELDGARTQDVADRLGISDESVRRMLQDMGHRYIMRRWVPHELTPDLRERRAQTARSNLDRLSREPDLLDRIIGIDETWLRSYTPPSGQEARMWTRRGSTP